MLERTAALEQMAVTRRAGVWTRLISHALALSEPGWKVPVLFRVPVDATAVWAFYRNGDAAALLAALGAPSQYPHAASWWRTWKRCSRAAAAFKPGHLESLLPRLQSECAHAAAAGRPEGRLHAARRSAGNTAWPSSTRSKA